MKIRFALGLLVSAILVFAIIFTIDWSDFWKATKSVHYIYILPSLLFVAANFYARAVQWYYLLLHKKKISIWRLYKVVMISFLLNVILPARLGEVARGIILAKREKLSVSFTLATVLMSRLFDGAVLFLLLGFLFLFHPKEFAQLQSIGITALFIYLLIVGFFVLYYFRHEATSNWIRRFVSLISQAAAEKITAGMDKFVEGFHVFKTPWNLVRVFILSLIVWGTVGAAYWLLLRGFNFSVPLPENTSLILLAITNLAIAIPSSPGFIGTMEAGVLLALHVANPQVSKGESFSFAIILHIVQVIPIIILGTLFFWIENLKISEITTAEDLSEEIPGI